LFFNTLLKDINTLKILFNAFELEINSFNKKIRNDSNLIENLDVEYLKIQLAFNSNIFIYKYIYSGYYSLETTYQSMCNNYEIVKTPRKITFEKIIKTPDNKINFSFLYNKHNLNKHTEFHEKFEDLKNNEIVLNSIFNLKLNIELIFNSDDYKFLLKFYENKIFIEKIYSAAVEIANLYKFHDSLIHLIVCDFLFAICSFNGYSIQHNFSYIITRGEYLSKIRVRCVIYDIIGIDYHKYLESHKKFLIALRKKNIIERAIVKKIEKIKQTNNHSTVIFIKLLLKENNIINYVRDDVSLDISNTPFLQVKLYNTEYLISSFRNVFKILRKKKEMQFISIDYNSIIKSSRIDFKLSLKLRELNKEAIENMKKKIFSELNINSFDEFFKNLYEIPFKEYESVENANWSNNLNKSKKINFLNQLQKIINIWILDKVKYDVTFFLPAFVDGRGRNYQGSLISPTFSKLFRNLYEFNKTKKFINLQESKFYKIIIKYKNNVVKFKKNNVEYTDIEYYVLIIQFIEIGKYFIKGEKTFIKTEAIINIGIHNYENKVDNGNFDDMLYIKKIYMFIDNFFKNNYIDQNTIIYKDATASGLQNYGIILGYKKDKLHLLNINGEDWCDTYMYLIEKFLDDTQYKKRKYWKSTIMTIPYNATWFTCYNKFKTALKEDGIECTKEEWSKLKKIHSNFYDKIKNNVKNEFYNSTESDFKNFFTYVEWIVVRNYEYKINFQKSRDKYTSTLFLLKEDLNATNTASEANNMHYLDSQLVKHVLNLYEVITIHDCFGIRLCELHLVMDEINSYYSKKIGFDTYSIHIII